MQKWLQRVLGRGSRGARRGVHRRWWMSLGSLASLLASGAALAQEGPLDVDLQFALDNGFESFLFAQTCLSVGEDGSVIEGDPVPVGGGRQLECETAPISYLQTVDVQASTGEPFCALGQVSSYFADGDSRLSVDVVSAPDGAPWVLVGTSDEEISVGTVTGFGGGVAWPLWVDALFDVIELQPNPAGELCDDVFGL